MTLASTKLSSFTQEAKNLTVIRAKLTMAEEFSNNSDVAIGIDAERDNGSVQIGVNLFGLCILRDGNLKIMKYDFDQVSVKFPPGSNHGSWNMVVSVPVLMPTFTVY